MKTKEVIAEMEETIKIYKERNYRLVKSNKMSDVHHGEVYGNLANELQLWVSKLKAAN